MTTGIKSALLTGVLLFGGSSAGCKGGDPIGNNLVPAVAEFVEEPRPANVTDHYVSLRKSSTNGGTVFLDMTVTDVDEHVAGIALKLKYPESFSKFVACTDGSLFPPGPCYANEPAPGSGEVFIGRTVMGSPPLAVTGDKVIVRLEFLVFGVEAGPITIEGKNLGGSDTSALLDGSKAPIIVEWYSGTLVGQSP